MKNTPSNNASSLPDTPSTASGSSAVNAQQPALDKTLESPSPRESAEKHAEERAGLVAKAAERSVWKPALKEAGVAFAAAAVLLSVIYGVWFFKFHPEFVPFTGHGVEAVLIPGKDFAPVHAGGGYLDGDTGVITAFKDGRAILALNANFIAEDYPFIQFTIEGLTTWANAVVMWRRAEDPDIVYQLPLNRSGGGVTQVAVVYANEFYRGPMVELSVGFMTDQTGNDNRGEPIRVHSAALLPFSAARVVEQVLSDWLNPLLWQGYANNIVAGVHLNGMVFPNVAANLLVVTGLLLAGLWRLQRGRRGKLPSTSLVAVGLCLCLYGWAFNDALRWQGRITQLLDAHERYAGLPLEARIRHSPVRCGRHGAAANCYEQLLPYF